MRLGYQQLKWKNIIRLKIFALIASLIGMAAYSASERHSALAQVSSDRTLSTTVTTTNNRNFLIEDGEVCCTRAGQRTGRNLFHSFDQFSIPAGGTAHFDNSTDIAIIFGRVTGGTASTIDGTISANGTADLFLINPNGLVFGPNAQLDIGGSFVGSTAEHITFADGTQFSAVAPARSPILSISTPIGLQMGQRSESITIQGEGHDIPWAIPFAWTYDNSLTGLSVKEGKSLALVGNGIEMDGGTIRSPGGHVHLGSVEQGQVYLQPSNSAWHFTYDRNPSFSDIRLTNASLIETGGLTPGAIQLQGQTIRLDQGSIVAIQNRSDRTSGAIAMNATDDIFISGAIRSSSEQNPALSAIYSTVASQVLTESFGTGIGGDIVMAARNVSLSDGGFIATRSYDNARTGTINVEASRNISISSVSSIHPEALTLIGLMTANASDSGEINLSSNNLSVTEGASTTSLNIGSGQGGNVRLHIANRFTIDGANSETGVPSNVGSLTIGSGNSGNLNVNVGQLIIDNGGALIASTFSAGDAGQINVNATQKVEIRGLNPQTDEINSSINTGTLPDLTTIALTELEFLNLNFAAGQPTGRTGMLDITTPLLRLTQGGGVGATNFAFGNGGNIRIEADRVVLDNGRLTSSALEQGGNIALQIKNALVVRNSSEIAAQSGEVGELLDVPTPLNPNISESEGNSASARGGSISMTVGEVLLSQDSEITTDTVLGQGGDITVVSRGPLHISDSKITSATSTGDGGNINLSSGSLLTLFNHSTISTTAGQTRAGGNGGNILIQSPFVVGILSENSDITANAFTGNGGNISLSTQGLFGLEFRDRPTPNSDITASSELGINGTVEISTPDVDPSSQVLELPDSLVDISQLVRPGCSLDEDQFVLAGRGGLPDSPGDSMNGDRPWIDLRDLSAIVNTPPAPLPSSPAEQPATSEPLQEATGMAIAPNGTLQLVSSTSQNATIPHARCTT